MNEYEKIFIFIGVMLLILLSTGIMHGWFKLSAKGLPFIYQFLNVLIPIATMGSLFTVLIMI